MKVRSVPDLLEEVENNSKKKVWLFNPDTEDFKVKYDGKEYILPAQETKKFPFNIASHIKKHLITHLANKRNLGYLTPQKRSKLLKEIKVKI